MKLFYSDQFVLPLPPGHRFPMEKYRLLRERLSRENRGRYELLTPPPAREEQLTLAHCADYVRRVREGLLTRREVRALGLPWSRELVVRSHRSCGGTIEACRSALDDGTAVNLAGGTHHAFRDRPQGFCVFNDCAVAARVMQGERLAARVLLIDCDVHQGNGSAAILRGDPSVFTFSIHGAKNFPYRKEVSDLDLELPDGTGDDAYLCTLERGLGLALARSRPHLAIYLAGADPFEGDRLGRLALTKDGLLGRDRMVFQHCAHAGVPIAVTMAGGYARQVEDTVDIHVGTVVCASGAGDLTEQAL